MKICVIYTISVDFEDFSKYLFILGSLTATNAKVSQYANLWICLEPKSLNHYLASYDKLDVISSLHAATTIMPLGICSFIILSSSSEDLYVSNIYANKILSFSQIPGVGSIITRCKPRKLPFLFFLILISYPFTTIFAKLPALKPADLT